MDIDKDYSIELPTAINKVRLIEQSLASCLEELGDICVDDTMMHQRGEFKMMWAGIDLLNNVIEDFERINKGLYGPDMATQEGGTS